MSQIEIEGRVVISVKNHSAEYEPSAMVGGGTIFLSISGNSHTVPIYKNDVESVIELLSRGRKMIEALEDD